MSHPHIIALVINRPYLALSPDCQQIRQEVVDVIMKELVVIPSPERQKKLLDSLKALTTEDEMLLLQPELPLYF